MYMCDGGKFQVSESNLYNYLFRDSLVGIESSVF